MTNEVNFMFSSSVLIEAARVEPSDSVVISDDPESSRVGNDYSIYCNTGAGASGVLVDRFKNSSESTEVLDFPAMRYNFRTKNDQNRPII